MSSQLLYISQRSQTCPPAPVLLPGPPLGVFSCTIGLPLHGGGLFPIFAYLLGNFYFNHPLFVVISPSFLAEVYGRNTALVCGLVAKNPSQMIFYQRNLSSIWFFSVHHIKWWEAGSPVTLPKLKFVHELAIMLRENHQPRQKIILEGGGYSRLMGRSDAGSECWFCAEVSAA